VLGYPALDCGVEVLAEDRPDGVLDAGKQILNLGLLTRIDAECMNLATFRPEFLDQGIGSGSVTSCNADFVPALGKAPGDGRTNRIARPDQQHNFVPWQHLDHLPAVTGHEAALTTLSAIILSMAPSP